MTTRPPSPVALEQAYRDAEYWIQGPQPLRLSIEHGEPRLDELLRQHGATRAALLTAANPGSRLRPAAENEHAHRALLARLEAAGVRTIPACGRDPRASWPDEAGVLALDVDLDVAVRLAGAFGQNAFVWCALGEPPRLVWTDLP